MSINTLKESLAGRGRAFADLKMRYEDGGFTEVWMAEGKEIRVPAQTSDEAIADAILKEFGFEALR